MKHYLILMTISIFWVLNTVFMMWDCHQNFIEQPSCYIKLSTLFFFNYYFTFFMFAYILRRQTHDEADRYILLSFMIYVTCLFLYFTQIINSDSHVFYTFATSNIFSWAFSILSFVLIFFNFILWTIKHFGEHFTGRY